MPLCNHNTTPATFTLPCLYLPFPHHSSKSHRRQAATTEATLTAQSELPRRPKETNAHKLSSQHCHARGANGTRFKPCSKDVLTAFVHHKRSRCATAAHIARSLGRRRLHGLPHGPPLHGRLHGRCLHGLLHRLHGHCLLGHRLLHGHRLHRLHGHRLLHGRHGWVGECVWEGRGGVFGARLERRMGNKGRCDV